MQLLINALIAGSLGALLAAGLALVYGLLGVFNMALGELALFAGYVTWACVVLLGWPLLPAAAAGLLTSAVLSYVLYEGAVAPFIRYHRFLPLIATIAVGMMLDGLLLIVFGEQARSILQQGQHIVGWGFARVSLEQLLLVAGTVVLLSAVAYVLHATKLGRSIRAVVQHASAAQSLGIAARRLQLGTFIASGVCAGLAGIFIGIDQTLTPVLGFSLTIKAYAAVIAGGKGNVWGAVVCAYGIALLEQLAVGVPWPVFGYVPAGFQQVVPLAVIIVLLLFRPQGLFVSVRRQG